MVLKVDDKPLMSDIDGQQEELPVYRLDESKEELQIGERRKCSFSGICERWRARCAERRARRAANGESCCRHSCLGRIAKWFFAVFLLFGIGHFFVMRHFVANHHATCVPITETTTKLSLPFASQRTRILLHPSVTTGNTHVVHSSTVDNGTIGFTVELPSQYKFSEDPSQELFICHVAKPRGVGVGIFTRDHNGPVPAVLSTTVTLTESVRHPKVSFLSGGHHGCMKSRFARKMVDAAIAEYDAKADADWVPVDDGRVEDVEDA